MKYIINCGGDYQYWKTPRQLTKICGEEVVARTIRLLREAGVDDIAISSNDTRFDAFGVPRLVHDNPFTVKDDRTKETVGLWVDGFCLTYGPACYLFGDVVFSPAAIRTIVKTETDDVEFFASWPPFSAMYPKKWAEPFAFKVADVEHFFRAIDDVRRFWDAGRWRRHPIAWELWQVVKTGQPTNRIIRDYTVINDYTCDIDKPDDAEYFRKLFEK